MAHSITFDECYETYFPKDAKLFRRQIAVGHFHCSIEKFTLQLVSCRLEEGVITEVDPDLNRAFCGAIIMVGAETAEHIAVHNHKVTIVEMLPAISPEMVSAPRHFLMKSLKDYEVDMYVNTKVLAIENQGILVETNGEKKFIPADLVVLATGSHANVALAEELKKEFPITMIGDTIHVGKAPDGIDEAYRLALTL